jgi:cob(I)alamin adenosyltransferase
MTQPTDTANPLDAAAAALTQEAESASSEEQYRRKMQ